MNGTVIQRHRFDGVAREQQPLFHGAGAQSATATDDVLDHLHVVAY
jgi:hypothetical protein